METVLLLVTIASAATALGMAAIVLKMLRDERRRSNARVEALMELSGASAPEPVDHLPVNVLVPSHFHVIPREPQAEAREPERRQTQERTPDPSPIAETDLDLNAPVAAVGAMFAEPETVSPWRNRLAVALGCAALVALVGFGASSLLRRDDRDRREGAVAQVAQPAQAAPAAAALDLLSLRHDSEGDTLTITGMVQNPRNGAALEHITATAFVFAQDGSFLASGRAPLDFTKLRPGEESPFVVKVSAAGVARYRVSFRDADDNVVGHVDRRNTGPLARRE